MMKKHIKEQWIKALRSGEYAQGVGYLKSGTGDNEAYCCLGVLCDLAVKAGADIGVYVDTDEEVWFFDTNGEVLPESVMEWSGLNSHIGSYGEGESHVTKSLAWRNDEGDSFAKIADLIEEHF